MEKRRGMPGPREDGWREIFEKIVFLASEESVQVSIAEFGWDRPVDSRSHSVVVWGRPLPEDGDGVRLIPLFG